MEKKDNWLFDVLFPVMYYRLARSVSYDEFIQSILVRKINYRWNHRRDWRPSNASNSVYESTVYSLCYGINKGIWLMFSISAKDAIYEQDIAFYANPKKKSYAAFAYDFSAKTVDSNICRIVDLVLPNDAILQIRDRILNRQDDEELRLRSRTILFPKETFEEVLVERDFASRV